MERFEFLSLNLGSALKSGWRVHVFFRLAKLEFIEIEKHAGWRYEYCFDGVETGQLKLLKLDFIGGGDSALQGAPC